MRNFGPYHEGGMFAIFVSLAMLLLFEQDEMSKKRKMYNMETNKFGILSLTPGRYKNIKGMLNPRPFMSKRRGKRFLDCIDKDIGVRPH